MPIRLIATDLDGTLLRSDLSVSPRTRRALDQARAAGTWVVPVTARQPAGVQRLAGQAGFTDWALCSNGALGINLGTWQVLFEEHVAPEIQRTLAQAILARVPEALFVSIRQAGRVFVAQEGYAAIAKEQDHKRVPATMGAYSLDEVLTEPSLKLVVRHPTRPPAELLAELQACGLAGFHATHSGAPFLEIAAAGVTKASGVAKLCQHLGIDQAEVLAFGDAHNDAEMLAWAGHGVAMAGAHPAAQAAADEVTLSNDQDGVALVIERLLGSSRPALLG